MLSFEASAEDGVVLVGVVKFDRDSHRSVNSLMVFELELDGFRPLLLVEGPNTNSFGRS